MKNIYSCVRCVFSALLLLLLVITCAEAQTGPVQLPNYPSGSFDCFPVTSIRATSKGATTQGGNTGYNPNGQAITARGELRVLIVYAGFTNDISQDAPGYNSGTWPQKDPSHLVDGTSFPANPGGGFYTSASQFSSSATDQTLSNFYYQMSQFSGNPLRMYAVVFPKRINIPADDATSGNLGFITYTQQVLNKLQSDPDTRNFNFSQVDRRQGTPNFQSDNSVVATDGIIDYVIVVWRNAGKPFGLNVAPYAGSGGFASVGYVSNIPSADGKAYQISTGFTHTLGMEGVSAPLFAHEFAHTFYSSPHYFNANGVVGHNLYSTEGPGMMGYFRTFFAANAWERWFNGWVDLKAGANGTNTDIQGPASLTPTSGQYTLRDYVTTGDVMRILIPNTTQYLWLENHQGYSVFDNRVDFVMDGQNPSQPFRPAPRGILAMVENASDSRNTPLSAFEDQGVNGLKVLSAQGNFDYTPSASTADYNGHFFGNQLYNFTNPIANPFGGENQITRHRFDSNNDGQIDWNPTQGNDGGLRNEMQFSVVKNGAFEDGVLGPDVTFNTVGQKMGISYNPAIFIHQPYDNATKKLSSIALNGLSVELLSKASNGDITVKVRYDDVAVVQNTRWTGDLRLVDVAGADRGYDLVITPFQTLTIDKSGTPNRTTKTVANDFINPTSLVCTNGSAAEIGYGANLIVQGTGTALTLQTGSTMTTAPNSKFTVKAGSLLDLQSGSGLTIQGQLLIEPGGTLVVRNGARLTIGNTVDVQAGAYICTEASAAITINSGSRFNISSGANYSTNPILGLTNLSCVPPTQCPSLAITGTYYCSTCTDRSTKTLLSSNNVSIGTYYITLAPNSAIFQPWSFGDSGSMGAYNTNSNQTGVVNLSSLYGAVAVSASAQTGCSSGTLAFRFYVNSTYSIVATPNPTTDELQVESRTTNADKTVKPNEPTEDQQFEAKLYSPYGQLVRTEQSQQGKLKINVRDLPSGLYTLRAGTGENALSEHIQISH
jgi:hypothetical protein